MTCVVSSKDKGKKSSFCRRLSEAADKMNKNNVSLSVRRGVSCRTKAVCGTLKELTVQPVRMR